MILYFRLPPILHFLCPNWQHFIRLIHGLKRDWNLEIINIPLTFVFRNNVTPLNGCARHQNEKNKSCIWMTFWTGRLLSHNWNRKMWETQEEISFCNMNNYFTYLSYTLGHKHLTELYYLFPISPGHCKSLLKVHFKASTCNSNAIQINFRNTFCLKKQNNLCFKGTDEGLRILGLKF